MTRKGPGRLGSNATNKLLAEQLRRLADGLDERVNESARGLDERVDESAREGDVPAVPHDAPPELATTQHGAALRELWSSLINAAEAWRRRAERLSAPITGGRPRKARKGQNALFALTMRPSELVPPGEKKKTRSDRTYGISDDDLVATIDARPRGTTQKQALETLVVELEAARGFPNRRREVIEKGVENLRKRYSAAKKANVQAQIEALQEVCQPARETLT